MDSLFQSLRSLERTLQAAGIDSALIGGVAVAIWGEPRLTRDVDVKVAIHREDVAKLLTALGPNYRSAYGEPLTTGAQMGMVFLNDCDGTRLDLLLADLPFDLEAIARAQPVKLAGGVIARVCTAEDLIIYKLLSTRPRDQSDVESVLRRQKGRLDESYILGWLREFELALDDSTLIETYQRMVSKLR